MPSPTDSRGPITMARDEPNHSRPCAARIGAERGSLCSRHRCHRLHPIAVDFSRLGPIFGGEFTAAEALIPKWPTWLVCFSIRGVSAGPRCGWQRHWRRGGQTFLFSTVRDSLASSRRRRFLEGRQSGTSSKPLTVASALQQGSWRPIFRGSDRRAVYLCKMNHGRGSRSGRLFLGALT
jgi:hypothetical protein